MKRKNREFINKIQYSNNEVAKKVLKSIKGSDRIFYVMYVLLTILYILLMVHVISIKGIFFITLLYFVLVIDLTFTQKRYTDRVMKETINKTICPEAYIDLNLYNARKLICNERMYKSSLNNIAYGYIQLGKFDIAEEIIKYLDSKRKDLILQSQIIQNKIDLAFLKDDIKKCNSECENLRKIIHLIPGRYKKEAKLNINLKQAVNDNNFEKVNELCEILDKKKKMFYKVKAQYYRGLVQEKRKKQNYEEYYKFVAENGNNLLIAKKVREKLEITESKNIYTRSYHIAYKAFKLLAFILLVVSVIFWSMYTIYIFNK